MEVYVEKKYETLPKDCECMEMDGGSRCMPSMAEDLRYARHRIFNPALVIARCYAWRCTM